MTDTQHQGVMAMVRIDGGKVKQLREQKGLTQLYVATVVQVTTDTISRWENKRYPTIKKENGIRLAEALEVELNEILETEAEDDEQEELVTISSDPLPHPEAAISEKALHSRQILLLCTLGVVILFAVLGWFHFRQNTPLHITAKRILPSKCTSGQPFPVTIEVTGNKAAPLTIILKEQLPENMSVQITEPPLPSSSTKNSTLKWLQKIEGKMLFTYIAKLSKPLQQGQTLSGTVAASNSIGDPVPVTGNNSIELSNFHWADSDGDNVISDKEILAVYDQYGDLEKLGIDIDLIEEIWLGSGYSWNVKKKKYEILP